jgi:putative Holliday junction resolvase
MPRFLALDPGTVTVGVAVSDETGTIARPLAAIPRRPHSAFLAAVGALLREFRPEALVVGLPLLPDGRRGKAAQAALALAHEIGSKLGARVVMEDESHSTQEALELLGGPLLGRGRGAGAADKLAAALILERYLGARARPGQGPGRGPSPGAGPQRKA